MKRHRVASTIRRKQMQPVKSGNRCSGEIEPWPSSNPLRGEFGATGRIDVPGGICVNTRTTMRSAGRSCWLPPGRRQCSVCLRRGID